MSEQRSHGLAIFDLDYTLTRRGTWGRFVVMNVKTRPHIWLPLLFSAAWTQWRYKQGHIPRIRVKQAMMKWAMVGQSKEALTQKAEEFARKEVEGGLRPGGLEVLEAHKKAGDTILIASAAVDLIVEPIAALLDVPHSVSTEMAWSGTGELLPTFNSKNCYGPEKLVRTQAYIADNFSWKREDTQITMYTDSFSDFDVLDYSDIPVAVHPDKQLRAYAENANWQIADWD